VPNSNFVYFSLPVPKILLLIHYQSSESGDSRAIRMTTVNTINTTFMIFPSGIQQ